MRMDGGFPSSYKLPELSESRRELNSRYKSTESYLRARPIFTELIPDVASESGISLVGYGKNYKFFFISFYFPSQETDSYRIEL